MVLVGAVVIIMIISISIAIIEEGIILPKEASDLSGCRRPPAAQKCDATTATKTVGGGAAEG